MVERVNKPLTILFSYPFKPVLTWGTVLLVGAMMPAVVGAQTLTVTHIRPASETDTRNQYFIRLLDLVLSKTDGPYRLEASPLTMQQGRALAQLKKNDGLDIVWTMTSQSREQELLPIRIPLLKGMIGTRLLLINQDDQHRFERITSEAQLKALRAGQGHDWPDTEVLKSNGYTVSGSASYDALFRMLARGRIDYFPRSVAEIWAEAEQHAHKGLIVEKSFVIYYPAAIYFFVNKDHHVLARRIEEGLRKAIADGSFDALFYERFNAIIKRARLQERRWFRLENPLLSPETPLDQPAVWYQP